MVLSKSFTQVVSLPRYFSLFARRGIYSDVFVVASTLVLYRRKLFSEFFLFASTLVLVWRIAKRLI